MITRRHRFVMGMLLTILSITGCGDDSGYGSIADLNQANADFADALQIAIHRFEHGDRNFGPSTNYDMLIQNEYWLNRMREALAEASSIEDSAIRMGLLSTPSNIRVALFERVRQRHQTLMDNERQIKIATEINTAIDMLRD